MMWILEGLEKRTDCDDNSEAYHASSAWVRQIVDNMNCDKGDNAFDDMNKAYRLSRWD